MHAQHAQRCAFAPRTSLHHWLHRPVTKTSNMLFLLLTTQHHGGRSIGLRALCCTHALICMHSARCMHVASCITHPTRPHPHPCGTAAQSCRLSSYLTPVHCCPCLPRCTPLQLLQGRSVPGRPQALQAEAVCGARDAQGCLWQPVPSGGALRTRLAGGEGPGVSQISERAALTAVWGAAWVAAREEVPVPAASCTPHTRS